MRIDLRRAGSRMLWARLVTGTVGNISVRDGDIMWITPTRCRWDDVAGPDTVGVRVVDGTVIEPGAALPSTESLLHLTVYRARPDVTAIVHTHSVYATAWSFTGAPLSPLTEETSYYRIRQVSVAEHARRGSAEAAQAAAVALGRNGAVLLSGHGVLAVSDSVDGAIDVAEAVEHQAHVGWLLRSGSVKHGGAQP